MHWPKGPWYVYLDMGQDIGRLVYHGGASFGEAGKAVYYHHFPDAVTTAHRLALSMPDSVRNLCHGIGVYREKADDAKQDALGNPVD